MLLAALAFVLIPLLRAPATQRANLSDDASNAAIFRAQKREIESEFAQSLIGEAERDRALRELEMRVVAEIADAPANAATHSNSGSRRTLIVAVVAAIAFPITAVLVYASLGTPQVISGGVGASVAAAPNAPQPNANNPGSTEPPMSDKQILAMVDALAQKMEQNPGDVKGWTLLARSQNALGRYADAAKAYERAITLEPKNAQLYADYADAAVMAQEGKFEGKPYALISQALKLDPVNMKALALAGTAEMRMGNKDASLKHWEKIKTLVAKDSDDYREVESIIAEVKTGAPPPRAPTATAPPSAPAPAAAASANASVTGQIILSPELTSKVAPSDTLFVFARAMNGPKMPLAVMRVPAPKSWPFKFELNDSMAMAPGMNLSAFPEVTIEARISKSGGAQPLAGDLAGQSAPTKPGASNVTVTISRVVP